jgi:hypothetical protein
MTQVLAAMFLRRRTSRWSRDDGQCTVKLRGCTACLVTASILRWVRKGVGCLVRGWHTYNKATRRVPHCFVPPFHHIPIFLCFFLSPASASGFLCNISCHPSASISPLESANAVACSRPRRQGQDVEPEYQRLIKRLLQVLNVLGLNANFSTATA